MFVEDDDIVIRTFGLAEDSIVDGPGLRFCVYVQGCSHRCPGCHNPKSQPVSGGKEYTVSELYNRCVSNKLTSGVTFSGGEPFEQAAGCIALAKKIRACANHSYNIWIYSGYTYEALVSGETPAGLLAGDLLELCDVLVDGRFEMSLHKYDLKWKGSSNQRVIDLNKTRDVEKGIVLWSKEDVFPEPPESW